MQTISTAMFCAIWFVAASSLSFFVQRTLLGSRFSSLAVDDPSRSHALHKIPTPRVGGVGVAIVCCLLVSLAMALRPSALQLTGPLIAFCVLAAFSFVDDRNGLSAEVRLAVHIVCAALITLVWSSKFSDLSTINSIATVMGILTGVMLLILAITWMTNLFNFMDGSDGMAGGMAVIGFGAYAIAASQMPTANATATEFAHFSAIISGAALGFLFFNFPPAKVFMGDAGSIPLGFLAATLGIQGYFSNLWPWWFPILVFSPFIVDATVTLLKRIAKREKIWLGHRQHAYQRLILSGWSHRRTALTYYALMLACAGSALLARLYEATPLFLVAWVIIYGLLLATVEIYLARKNKKKSEPL